MALPWKGETGRRVRGVGPRTARVVLLAEAPGETEEQVGQPLVGQSGTFLFDGTIRGTRLTPWPGIAALGLSRDVVRLENVLESRPLNNDLDVVSLAAMEKAQADCWARLDALGDFDLIVPMGNCALNALLRTPLKRKKKRGGGYEWKWAHTISAWRGSVNTIEVAGRAVTMIPTFHPANFLWNESANFAAWRADWTKIARAAECGIEESPKFNTLVAPTPRQVSNFEALVRMTYQRDGNAALLALDIETIGPLIDCIGFCVDGENTITLPLLPQLCEGGSRQVREHWGVIERLCAHAIPKGTHFGFYDVYRLERQKGFTVRKWWWDWYLMGHLLDPADQHSLAYRASIGFDIPYWKHESKWDRKALSKELKNDWKRRHRYCGKDVGTAYQGIMHAKARLGLGWEPTWTKIGM